MSTGAVTALTDALVDNAAIFPPGNAPLPQAVLAHRKHTGAWYGSVVGPFLVSDARMGDLSRLLEAEDGSQEQGPLVISLVVTGGAGALEAALTWVSRDARLRLRAVEIALRDEDDLARNARRVAVVTAGSLPDEAAAYIELPRDHSRTSWQQAADVVAESGHRLKLRTGGGTASAHPDPVELAGALSTALDREVAIKCTAGLHHAVRNTAPDTGFEQHGFLNVALAILALLDGASDDDAVRVLAERNESAIASACSDMDTDTSARLRRWFTSFGSCSIDEPVTDLVELGLLAAQGSSGATVPARDAR